MPAGPPINRNDPCPCGSGRKYKKCCLGKDGASFAGVRETGSVDVDQLLRRGTALHRSGSLEAAAGVYRQILGIRPRHAAALFYLGQITGQLGDVERGIRLLRQSLAVDGTRARTYGNLAALLLESGDADGSLECARRAVELDPSDHLAHRTAAACLCRLNRPEAAAGFAERAAALRPEDPECRVLLATVARQKGSLAEARAILESVVSAPGLDSANRRGALYQLGLVLDRLGVYDEAFASFAACGAVTKSLPATRRFDRGFWSRRIAGFHAAITVDLLERWRDTVYDDAHPVPVFMVGFPRSGTTLTEQILAAHPRVATSDERPYSRAINDAIVEMFDPSDGSESVPGLLRELKRDHVAALRDAYWSAVRESASSDLSGRVFIDKLPLNVIDIGLLNIVFPEARVIFALRDPRDVCLSCLMQDFRLNAAMANFLTLEDTVRFYGEVMDLWLTIRERLTIPVIEARYEDTVRDQPTHARRLLAFLDLEWDDRVVRFHEIARERHISTPSFEAVTQPIHTRAVARWRHYEEQIAPYVPGLWRFLDTFGYGD